MNMKYTIPGQILSVILTHIKAAFLFFIVWLLAISLTSTQIGGIIYSSVSAAFYFIMMYATGYTIEKNDKKSYSKLTPVSYKGALLPLGLSLLNILTLIIYKLSWALGSNGENIENWWALAGNIFGLFWFSPYMNILGMETGKIAPYGYAIIFLLHELACFAGYFAGYKDFDISAKFSFLMYEKKKK